ncbi:hypothetical protein KIN20_028945 [Parelaphostrongylus tenuis]|uniref:Uncharacterized protein n=1 Tax=Parelaphostrongylus tenuis TaxID=148309 RepID=A0AAD5R1U5_PARTN|nr:hypothetical protein KIN20_028945 [Parelaphostrongylus tenuis]
MNKKRKNAYLSEMQLDTDDRHTVSVITTQREAECESTSNNSVLMTFSQCHYSSTTPRALIYKTFPTERKTITAFRISPKQVVIIFTDQLLANNDTICYAVISNSSMAASTGEEYNDIVGLI